MSKNGKRVVLLDHTLFYVALSYKERVGGLAEKQVRREALACFAEPFREF